jgi:CRISPR-associated protein Cas8b1/Cst1 subtype I-B
MKRLLQMSFSRSKKEFLKESIDKLEANEHSQIFSIIKRYTETFTRTQNEVLVSTNNLNDDCLKEIESYIHFCVDQKKRMEDDSRTRKGYERMVQSS